MTSTRATSASWSVVLLALCIAGTLQPFSAQAQTVPVPPGLVAWWSGEGNANDRLGSSNGTLAPGTSFVAGKVGQAFSLDGSREGVILGNPAALALQDLTFEAWVKRAVPAPGIATLDNPGWGGMLINHGPAGYAFYIMPNGQLGFGQETVTEVLSGPLLAVTDTNWHHVAVTKEGTTLVFYVDGVSKTVLGFTSVFTFGNLAGVGRDGYSELNSFYGSIDEMSVYNRALSAAEIQAIAAAPGGKVLVDPVPAPQAQTVPVPPGLVAWWSGEGNASDRLGASNGTLAPGISFVTGKVGQAFSLDAVSEGVSLGNATQPAALQLQNFTIETWVKRAVSAAAIPPYATLDNPGWGGILIDYGPGGYALELLPNGQLGFGQETVNEVPSGPLLAVTDTNWHHVAVTKAGTTLVFYVDGVSNTVLGYSNVFTFGNSAAVGMGGGPARKAQSFYGSIDEMSVYNRALTAAEIQAIAVAPGGKAFSYMVTATAGTNGSISPSGAVSVNQGASQTFSITPSTGYHIAGVLADGSSVGAVGSYSFSNVTANHTISASFAINTYTLTATAGSNGSITPSGTSTVNYGGNQAFTITPNVGYHVADVVVDGSSAGMVGSYSFANIAADHTISASFAADSYAITASAGANGSISPSGTTAVNYGSSQAFTITPSTGYHIADVLVDGASVGAVGSYTINTVTTDHTVIASFAINTYTLTATAGVGGTIAPPGVTTVTYGSSQTFTIVASAGYGIAEVAVDGTSVGAVSSYSFTSVTTEHTISASFADITPPVITLNGPNPLLLELGTPFVDPGATASDLVDGDLTASIQTSDNVDPSTEGTYTRTYTVRDQAGNSASATRTVQVVVTPNSYGLIATHSLHLRQSARLLSGFVGVVNQGQKPFLAGKVELVVGTKVQTAQSVRLSAPRVQVRQSTTIAGELVYTQLLSVGKKATIAQKTQVPASYFPLFQGFGLPAFQTGTPGSRDVEVKQKASATLSAGSYGEVQVKQKGTLTFSGGTYSLRSLEAGPNSKVLFLAPTILLIREQLSLDQNSTFGPATGSGISAADILVYVEGRNGRPSSDDGDNEGDDEEDDAEGRNLRKSPKVAKVGVNVSFQGNLYAPNGTIHLRQGSACVGAFIGRDIIVGVRAQVAVQSGWNTPGVVYQPAPIVSLGKLADAQGAEAALPQGAGLLANYPNPFNPSTTIPYVLTEIAPVKLSVYNVLGQQIRVLVDQLQVPGAYEVSWDGMDAAGVQVAGGVYFCRLEAGEHQVVSRMLLLK